MSASSELARLLEHPAIWRGTRVARPDVLPSGYGQLDAHLPGGGWPSSGLIEVLVSRFGVGELTLLLPAMAALTARPMARWCAWVAPPLDPYPPALAAHGLVLNRTLVVRVPTVTDPRNDPSHGVVWAFEQSLGSGACDLVLAWARRHRAKDIRRLQLAAERGRALGVLFRPSQAARHASHAILRIAIEPAVNGTRVTVLKSRGGTRGSFELALPAGG